MTIGANRPASNLQYFPMVFGNVVFPPPPQSEAEKTFCLCSQEMSTPCLPASFLTTLRHGMLAWPGIDRKTLQRVVSTAQSIVGCPFISPNDIAMDRSLRRVRKILGGHSHPSHNFLPSGRRYRSMESHINRLRDSWLSESWMENNSMPMQCDRLAGPVSCGISSQGAIRLCGC